MKLTRDTDLEEIYKVHRGYIEHEDELIHHRMTAFITIQSFLLATFGFTYQKKYEIAEKLHDKGGLPALGQITDEYNLFLMILAFIGAMTSLIALRSVNAATRAIRELEKNWLKVTENSPPNYLPGITGGGDSRASSHGVSLSTWAPTFLLVL